MGIVLIGVLIFVLTFSAGLGGLAVQRRLPSQYTSDVARGVVGQVSSIVSLLLALVLGTLVGVSFAYFSTQRTELETFASQVLRFDQALKQFGRDAQPVRDAVRQTIEKGYQVFWGGGEVDPALMRVEAALKGYGTLDTTLAQLQPATEAQKSALATAKTYAGLMEQSRLLMSLQVASQPVPWIVVVVLVLWTVALFFGIGIFAPSNPVVLTAFGFGAASIAFAVFLFLELGMPYSGLFRVPAGALEQTMQIIGQ